MRIDFYRELAEELRKRGFLMITTKDGLESRLLYLGRHSINGVEDPERYAKHLRENYDFAAVKNVSFEIGGESVTGFYEILGGSRACWPFPTIFINLKHRDRLYRVAYQCSDIGFHTERGGCEAAVEYVVESIRYLTSRLADVLCEWTCEGTFPTHRFAEGSEELIMR